MSGFLRSVNRLLAENPGMTYSEACSRVARAGARKRRERKAAEKRAKEEAERQRRYVQEMEERGLW